MSDPRLKSLIERIERLREEKKAITADERDIFAEAKSGGYDGKALREVLKRRAMDESARAEWDSLVELYEVALGGKKLAADAIAGGASIRQAAKASGLSVGSVAALATVQKTTISEHDEIHRGAMQPKGCAKVVRTEPSMPGSVAASGDAVRDASAMPLDVVAAPYREGREHAGSAAAAPSACDFDLTIPAHLRREKAA